MIYLDLLARFTRSAIHLMVLSYPERKLKLIVIQDGTNSVRKKNFPNTNDLNKMQQELIVLIRNTFNPKMIVICEVPPIFNSNEANSTVETYNSSEMKTTRA